MGSCSPASAGATQLRPRRPRRRPGFVAVGVAACSWPIGPYAATPRPRPARPWARDLYGRPGSRRPSRSSCSACSHSARSRCFRRAAGQSPCWPATAASSSLTGRARRPPVANGRPGAPLTSAFLHASLIHLAINGSSAGRSRPDRGRDGTCALRRAVPCVAAFAGARLLPAGEMLLEPALAITASGRVATARSGGFARMYLRRAAVRVRAAAGYDVPADRRPVVVINPAISFIAPDIPNSGAISGEVCRRRPLRPVLPGSARATEPTGPRGARRRPGGFVRARRRWSCSWPTGPRAARRSGKDG